jgi:hypothetical protein
MGELLRALAFSPKTSRNIVENCGVKVLRIWREELDCEFPAI